MDLSFDEIKDWSAFENLAAEYFRNYSSFNDGAKIINVDIKQSGHGADGGRDILVKNTIDDGFKKFERIWIIQCKFYAESVKRSHLADINIPSLIHSYNADGYLLICKNEIGGSLTDLLDDLENNCKFGYKYLYWHGDHFKIRLRFADALHKHFFPRYHDFINSKAIVAT